MYQAKEGGGRDVEEKDEQRSSHSFKGVDAMDGKWRARLVDNGGPGRKTIGLGLFAKAEDAARAWRVRLVSLGTLLQCSRPSACT